MGSVDASDPAGDAPAPPAMSMPQLAVAGGVSGLVARFATHPFDTLKTQMQVAGAVGGGDVPSSSRGGPASTSAASASARHRGALETARALVRREGPLGFYRGFGAVVAGIPFASAAYFGGYEAAKRAVDAFRDAAETRFPLFLRSAAAPLTESPTFSYVASGVIAQSFASVAYTPIDVVKERMQASGVLGARLARGRYDGVVAAYRTILQTEGARGAFRGYWASNFTWWPFSVVYFVAYEHMRDAAVVYVSERARAPGVPDEFVAGGFDDARDDARTKTTRDGENETLSLKRFNERAAKSASNASEKDALPPWVSGACGFAAAAVATVATHPLDLAKTRLQTLRTEPKRAETVPGSKSEKSATRKNKNVFSIARDVFRREGATRLFAGCGARVAAVAPGSAISFFVYEGIKEWMNA